MSCNGASTTFRLLDAFVGWDAAEDADSYKYLTGLDEEAGVRLAQLNPEELDVSSLASYIPPPRLARGCGPCDWFLIPPVPPEARLLHLNLCACLWTSVWDAGCAADYMIEPVAVAAWKRRVAVSDRGAGMVWVWSQRGARLSAAIAIRNPGPLAFTPTGELLVTSEARGRSCVYRFGPVGESRGELPELPSGRIDRIAVSGDGAVWLLIERDGVSHALAFQARREELRSKAGRRRGGGKVRACDD